MHRRACMGPCDDVNVSHEARGLSDAVHIITDINGRHMLKQWYSTQGHPHLQAAKHRLRSVACWEVQASMFTCWYARTCTSQQARAHSEAEHPAHCPKFQSVTSPSTSPRPFSPRGEWQLCLDTQVMCAGSAAHKPASGHLAAEHDALRPAARQRKTESDSQHTCCPLVQGWDSSCQTLGAVGLSLHTPGQPRSAQAAKTRGG
jgi:hypothetical protein